VLTRSPAAGGCAALRGALDEPLRGTAPERAASWLLVEHPGPWPSEELPADLPAQARRALDEATEAGVRPQLVRRVTERRSQTATVMLASCRPGSRWLERTRLTDLRELADLDLAALARGEQPGFGVVDPEPVVLVCTHGRRDVCCARLGRPLATLLDAQLPGQVWETTHVGGDRFAPNVVALPDGSYHGGVGTAEVPALAAALMAQSVLLPRLRGRAGLPSATQAADVFLREHTGETAVDAVVPLASTPSPSGEVCVELLADGARWCVHVMARPHGAERLTSCAGGGTVGTPTAFDLLALRRLA
jgi:hypothetical protein